MLNTIIQYIALAATIAAPVWLFIVAPILEARTQRANMRAWKRMTVAADAILRERREAYQREINQSR